MEKYKIKDGLTFDAVKWGPGKANSVVTRYCSSFCLNTGCGVLRVETGDYVVKGQNGFKMVLKEGIFNAIFEKVD